MSRSYKKNAVCGYVKNADSEKQDKRLNNRRLRKHIRQLLSTQKYDILPELKEVSNIKSMAKDGKQRVFADSSFYREVKRK